MQKILLFINKHYFSNKYINTKKQIQSKTENVLSSEINLPGTALVHDLNDIATIRQAKNNVIIKLIITNNK